MLSLCNMNSVHGASVDFVVDDAGELKALHGEGVYKRKEEEKEGKSPSHSKKDVDKGSGLALHSGKNVFWEGGRNKKKIKHDPIFSDVSELREVAQYVDSKGEFGNRSIVLDKNLKEKVLHSDAQQKNEDLMQPDQGELQGLVFVSNENFISDPKIRELYVKERKLHVRKVQSVGFVHRELELAVNKASLLLHDYIGQKISVPLLDEIISVLKTGVRESSIPFANIYAPPQDVRNGIVFIVVKPSLVEDIRVADGRYFDKEQVLEKIGQKIGEPVDTEKLERDLQIASLHPDREVKASFSQGSVESTTLVNLDVEEQKPWRVYTSFANDGSSDLDKEQISIGAYHNNLWKKDHAASYQFTTSSDHTSLKAHNIRYDFPLWGAQKLSLRYGRSDTEASILDGVFATEGRFRQLGVRYQMPFLDPFTVGDWALSSHKVSIGADHKDIKGDILFTLFGDPLDTGLGADVEVVNSVIEYEGVLSDPYEGQTKINAEFIYSPGGLTDENEDLDFETTRADVHSRYVYARLFADRSMPLSLKVLDKNLFFNSGVQGQFSPHRLIGSERYVNFSKPGFRGYESGAFSGDSGVGSYFELETSRYNMITTPTYKDSLKVGVFTDFGVFYNNDAQGGEDNRKSIWASGVSFDYRVNDRVSSVLTLSQDLSGQDDSTNQEVMYRLLLSY